MTDMVIQPLAPPAAPSHPSERAIRKLRAASRGLETISASWDAYRSVAQVTYDLTVDEPTMTARYIAHVSVEPPLDELEDELRSVVADGRSALDNLVHDLGVEHGLDQAQLRKNAFPVFDTAPASWPGSRSKLSGLPSSVLDRIRDVQPFSHPVRPGIEHPAVLLNKLSNDDKHRQGLALGLLPHIVGSHRLATAKIEVPRELAAQFTDNIDADQVLDFNPNPVVDGTAVVTVRLPPATDLKNLTLSPLDLPLSLALIRADDAPWHPVIPSIGDALRWARETARYVSGASDQVPEPRDRSLLA